MSKVATKQPGGRDGIRDEDEEPEAVRKLEYLTVTHGSSWSLPQISGLNEDSTRTRQGLGQDWMRTGSGLDVESPAKLRIFQSTSSPPLVHL